VRISTELPNPLHKHNKLHLARRDVETTIFESALAVFATEGVAARARAKPFIAQILAAAERAGRLPRQCWTWRPAVYLWAEAKRQALQQSR
jgi:hypothetical protein